MRPWITSRRQSCTRRPEAASSGVIEVVQINVKLPGSRMENFHVLILVDAVQRPRETFGRGFAGR